MQWVAYLECQGLYAAVHRAAAGIPERVPVVVVAAEGAVLDGCPLALAQGLRLGVPRRQAQRQVPGARCCDHGTVDYTAAARAFWDTCAAFSPRVEPLRPHQAFVGLPVPGRQPPAGELERLVAAVQAAVARAAGLAAGQPGVVIRSGLAAGKLVARAAAETAAPGAPPVVVAAGREAEFLAPLPVAALWPARPELRRRLADLGISRIADLGRISEAELWRQFGPEGRQLAQWARGVDPDPVRPAWPPRTVTWRTAFPAPAGPEALPAEVARAARELARALAGRGEVCQAVSLTLELEPGAGPAELQARRTLPRRTQSAGALAGALLALQQQVLAQAGPQARCLALTAAAEDLAPAAHRQLDLWGEEVRREEERAERLALALAALSARFPARTARVGWPEAATRREAMLRFYDPLLAAAGPRAAGPAVPAGRRAAAAGGYGAP